MLYCSAELSVPFDGLPGMPFEERSLFWLLRKKLKEVQFCTGKIRMKLYPCVKINFCMMN